MQKIDSRKWMPNKESFDDYAIDKLALMYRVDLPEQDRIHLLVSGIQQTALKATALAITDDKLDGFLEEMRKITQGTEEWDKKPTTNKQDTKPKDGSCKNCGKKGHNAKECRSEGDIILGREFLTKGKLTLVYNPAAKGDREKINLFANLPLCVDNNRETETLESTMSKHEIDYGQDTKIRLEKLVRDISKQITIPVDDQYAVE
ncbi:hypothetical protein RF55_17574, partial [Lasius niger]